MADIIDVDEMIKRQQQRLDKRPEPKRDDPDISFLNELIEEHQKDELKKGYKCPHCKAFVATTFQKAERITLGQKYPMMVFYRSCLSCGFTFVPKFCLNVLNKCLKHLASEGAI